MVNYLRPATDTFLRLRRQKSHKVDTKLPYKLPVRQVTFNFSFFSFASFRLCLTRGIHFQTLFKLVTKVFNKRYLATLKQPPSFIVKFGIFLFCFKDYLINRATAMNLASPKPFLVLSWSLNITIPTLGIIFAIFTAN